ncbi:MAG: SDR family NAD(P)-dependent oxidoreductase [Dehalococcoidia bacterium]
MGRLENKVAVITGAGSGMGRATALLFAREGAAVLVADVNERGGEETVERIAAEGGRAAFLRTDVASSEDVHAMLHDALDRFGALDVLFNNAGIAGESGRLAEQSEASWQRVLDINLTGVYLGMRHAIPVMLERGGGSIISTASVAGMVGFAGAAAYCAAKAGVISLTRVAAVEYARWNIRVNCICPGVVETPLLAEIYGGDVEADRPRLLRRQPLPRFGTPEDIAQMALYLASDESAYVTGAAMVVDGGYTAR